MTTKRIRFSKIKTAAYNPRIALKPEDPEWKDIEASLNEFGYLGGMVVNIRTNTLVAGHQRMAILQAKGVDAADFATVDLDPADEKRLNLAMNKVGGRWDNRSLEQLLASMKSEGIDLGNLGFSPVELKELLNRAKPKPTRDPDAEAPAPPPCPITRPGDLIELWTTEDTRHRVICGDSTKAETWQRLMGGNKARMVFIDPPFGVSYISQAGTGNGAIANDDLRGDKLIEFLAESLRRLHESTIDRAAMYCFYASRNHIQFETAMNRAGWTVKQQLIWAKQMVLGRSDYHWAHEPILTAVKNGKNSDWLGDRTETTLYEGTQPDPAKMTKEQLQTLLSDILRNSTVWEEKKDTANTLIHSTQKPTSLARRALRNSSLPGDIVIDSFLGSHSTLIAAELEGRRCYGIELDPAYVDVGIQRYRETFANTRATRNGKEF